MIDLEKTEIKPALKEDAGTLTEIAFAAKRHWNYPEDFIEIWRNELTITPDYIDKHTVYKTVFGHSIIGFYSIIEAKTNFYAGEVLVKKGFWLEHIFILPAFHNCGIGKYMISHIKQVAINLRIHDLLIFVDPYSKGFYDKIGAEYLYDSKSSINERLIPVYKLKIY